MMMIEDIKKDRSDCMIEMQENTGKQAEDIKEQTQKSLKELQENTTKQMKKLKNTIQGLKSTQKQQRNHKGRQNLEIEKLGKRSGIIDANITNRTQEIEDRISDIIENTDTTVKENAKCKKLLTHNIQEAQDTVRRPNLGIIGIEESDDCQL